MSEVELPNPESVEYIKYYDLNKRGFDLTKSETSPLNQKVLNDIISDFSSEFKIAPLVVKDAFKVEYLSIRTTEDILILYNNRGNDDVRRLYTNVSTPTFKIFF